jgi:DNA-binding transcriptional LysR family regulator
MDVANLRTFVAVSREGSVARAAETLGLTASPVSRSLRELEKALGYPLFTRNYHALNLTPEGTALLPTAVDVVTRFDALFGTTRHPLRAGCSTWVARRYHERLRSFTLEEGGELEDQDTPYLVGKLLHGDLDMILVWGPIEDAGLTTFALSRVPLIVRAAERFTKKKLTFEDLRGKEILMPPYVHLPSFRQKLETEFEGQGMRPPTAISFVDMMRIESRLERTGAYLVMFGDEEMPLADQLDRMQLAELDSPDLHGEVTLAFRTQDPGYRALAERALPKLVDDPAQLPQASTTPAAA